MPKTSADKPLHLNGVDLFAGAGGFSQAAKNVGLNIVAAVEMNLKACETYTLNLVSENVPKLYPLDINKLEPSQILIDHFSNGKKCDFLLGGPPCQGFSIQGVKNPTIEDPRNKLVLRYFEFVRQLQPKIFLMENVPGILWPKHRSFLDELYSEGRKANYRLFEPVILDARNFGVPQRRKRVFVLGVHNDVQFNAVWPPKPTHGDKQARIEKPELADWIVAGEVFAKAIAENDENNIHMQHTPELTQVFLRTPINGGSRHQSGRILPCHKKHKGHKDVYGRIDPAMPSPTMTTACVNPSKGRFVHPTEPHGITVRHAARFQTFPDNFVFKGGLTAASMQIGNAVPVRMAEVLLKTILNGLTDQRDSHD